MSDGLSNIERLDAADERLQAMLEQTRVELLALRRRNYQLTATVVSLVDVLAKQGALDATAFYTALDTELASGPFSIEHPEALPDERHVNCSKCWRAVTREQAMLISGGGWLCGCKTQP
jgi:hypothetical protein